MTAAQTAVVERDLSVREISVHMRSAGSGEPLLYLHGAGDLGDWTPALTALAEHHTVYRPDHPGFNESADAPGVDTIHELAFWYLDLLDALGLDRVTVVGASLGGWVAADLATIEPHRVSRLVLVGAAGVRADVSTPDVFTLSPTEHAEHCFHADAARAAAVARMAAVEADPARFERYLRNRIATAHLGWNPYLHDPKLPRRLHRITAPTMVLWGAHDRLLPLAHAHRWIDVLPRASLTVVDDAGHLPLVERPDVALGALRAFLGQPLDPSMRRGNQES